MKTTTKPKRPSNRHLEEHGELERQQRDAVIAEFEAGDTEATLQAMATAIVEHRRAVCIDCSRPPGKT